MEQEWETGPEVLHRHSFSNIVSAKRNERNIQQTGVPSLDSSMSIQGFAVVMMVSTEEEEKLKGKI